MLKSILDWIAANPALFALIWSLVTAAASVAVKAVDKTSRGHAVLSFLAGAGIDLPKLLDAVKRLLAGGSNPPPQGGAKATVVSPPVAMMLAIALALSVSGCALFSPAAGAKFPADVEEVAACVTTQIESGVTDVPKIVLACDKYEAALVLDVVEALVNSHQFNADHPKQMPWVRASMKSLAAQYR